MPWANFYRPPGCTAAGLDSWRRASALSLRLGFTLQTCTILNSNLMALDANQAFRPEARQVRETTSRTVPSRDASS
jgi:hypothetical protein